MSELIPINELSRRAQSIAESKGLSRMAAWREAIRRNPRLAAAAGRATDDGDDRENECSSCGASLAKNAKFCQSCGAPVSEDAGENFNEPDEGRKRYRPGPDEGGGKGASAVSALFAMERRVQQIVAASGGKLSKPRAYAQFLATREGAELYREYEDGRETACLTRKGRAEYARSMHSLMQSAGYGTGATGITDNLPEHK